MRRLSDSQFSILLEIVESAIVAEEKRIAKYSDEMTVSDYELSQESWGRKVRAEERLIHLRGVQRKLQEDI